MIIFLLILLIPYSNLIAWAYYKEPIFFACIGKQKQLKIYYLLYLMNCIQKQCLSALYLSLYILNTT